MSVIRTLKLCKQFQQTAVLSNVDLEVQSGERWGLIGPSGAGKTTLLRMLCGLESPSGGEIWLADRRLEHVPPGERHVALVTQDYPLYPHLTVQQNLQAALAARKQSTVEAKSLIQDTLTWFQIADLKDRWPSEISGGQAQRVALARALVRRPEILLLDEPLSQVDTPLRHELRDLILAACQRYQATLMIVTHDPQDALWLSTHLAVLERGILIQRGPATEVYRSPSTATVAELLSPYGICWLDFGTEESRNSILAESVPASAQRLGIRPEHVRKHDETANDPTTIILAGEITSLRDCGFAQMATARIGLQTLHAIDWNKELRVGEVKLSVLREQCVWL